jgi:ABC-type phosphate/phosphonate transport system substrate-binding protein
MIASLPMYDRPETAETNDRFWAGIARGLRARGLAAPAALDRERDLWETWLSPDLVLSQTCGFPYRARLHRHVALVATPVLDLPHAPPGRYYSVLVARRGDGRRTLADFDGAALAYNDPLSQSGWAAPSAAAASEGIAFGRTVPTGAHRASARAVADGAADLAAIDALTWRMIRRWDDVAADLEEIGTTAPTPALPWITSPANDAAAIAEALAEALDGLGPADRDALGILGTIRISPAEYLAVPTPPAPPANGPDSPQNRA